jgi:hypothetical protein
MVMGNEFDARGSSLNLMSFDPFFSNIDDIQLEI